MPKVDHSAPCRARSPVRAARLVGVLAGLILCLPASAQRVLVTTTTFSAAREACRVYLHCAEMRPGGKPLPGAELLPGVTPMTPILLTPDGTAALLISGEPAPWTEPAASGLLPHIAAFRTAPWGNGPAAHAASDAVLRDLAACILPDPETGEPRAVLAGTYTRDDGVASGRLYIYPGAGSAIIGVGLPSVYDLPGTPVAVTALPDSRVAVLCRGPSGMGALLHVRSLTDPATAGTDIILTAEGGPFGAYPTDMALGPDPAYLFVLASGYALDRPSGDAVSWVYALDPRTLDVIGAPVELPGIAHSSGQPLHPVHDGACWVATHTPGAAFAYAVRVRATPSGPVKELQTPFTGVSRGLRLAPDPSGDGLAVGVDNHLELWTNGQRDAQASIYDAPIEVLRWTPGGLFVGEGPYLHLMDPASRQRIHTVQFTTGLVTDVALIPGAVEPAPGLEADSDADGIPNIADPEPLLPSPRLSLPTSITFRGEAVGREVRAFVIDPPFGRNSAWRVFRNQAATPWLVVAPVEGQNTPSMVCLGVDPTRCPPGQPIEGALFVAMSGSQPDLLAADSPGLITIRVAPVRAGVRRILWMWADNPDGVSVRDASDPRGLRALAELLAAPPHYFTQREVAGPFLEPLAPYTVVVLDAAAAARGALTRQALLDYVTQGGGLLLLGRYLPGQDNSALLRWLSPIGIEIDTTSSVSGDFSQQDKGLQPLVPSQESSPLGRHAASVTISGGCGIQADPEAVIVGGGDGNEAIVLAARDYGYGRVAVLAAPTPFESPALALEENRLLADDLFRWLAAGSRDAQDKDGDGLTDDTEDRNKNGFCDLGETDFLKPDTDGDGIPDGLEDRNRNGDVDEGETDPRNPDSDGDGLPDGADAQPLPVADAPRITDIEPNLGPAEGATPVVISGRNLTPGTVFWFGDRLARNVQYVDAARVQVETPPYYGAPGSTVDVRAFYPPSNLEAVLPAGFRYIERTCVRLSARSRRVSAQGPGGYDGSIAVELETPDIATGRILFSLKAEPSDGFEWQEPVPGAAAKTPGREVRWRKVQSNALWVDASGGRGGGELITIPWTVTGQPDPAAPLRIVIDPAYASAPNGTSFALEVQPAVIHLGRAAPPSRAEPARE